MLKKEGLYAHAEFFGYVPDIPLSGRCPACGRKVVSFPMFGKSLGVEWVCRECFYWVWKIRAWAEMPRRERVSARRRVRKTCAD